MSQAEPHRHCMPAGSIGYFSRQLKVKRRNRSIFVCRKASGKIFSQRPDNVGWKPKVYGQGKGPWMDFDNYFKRFESLNNDTISALLRGTGKYQDADIWLRLATYVSSLIARNPDTELTLLKTEYGENPNISVGYPVDMQRIAGAIYRTRWLIATCREDELILPDRGFFFHLLSAVESVSGMHPTEKTVYGNHRGREPKQEEDFLGGQQMAHESRKGTTFKR